MNRTILAASAVSLLAAIPLSHLFLSSDEELDPSTESAKSVQAERVIASAPKAEDWIVQAPSALVPQEPSAAPAEQPAESEPRLALEPATEAPIEIDLEIPALVTNTEPAPQAPAASRASRDQRHTQQMLDSMRWRLESERRVSKTRRALGVDPGDPAAAGIDDLMGAGPNPFDVDLKSLNDDFLPPLETEKTGLEDLLGE